MQERLAARAPRGCPDDDVLVGLARGASVSGWEGHLETCATCRAILAVVAAEDSGPDGAEASTLLDTTAPMRRLAPERPPLSPGHRLGRYLIEAPLGQGGMGVVYAARDPLLGRTVALKLLRSGAGGDAARARLVREAQAMARLAHPHVLPLFELGVEDGRVFLVMERVEGPTLAEWLTARERPWREVLALLLQAGEGLAAAHRAGLVHRDFKPGNVLVGADGRPRVTDFGLVRDGGGEPGGGPTLAATADALTQAGAVLGTPAYMAPEQLAGREVDARGDQFSFCVTLHEALLGVRPFDARAPDEAARWRRVPWPRSPRLPRTLRAVLDRGLAPRPEARFESLDALLEALREASRFRWRPVALAVGVGIVLALGMGTAGVVQRQEAQEEAPLALRLGESLELSLPGIERLAVDDSEVVVVDPPEGETIRLRPRGPGRTHLWVWTREGRPRRYALSVEP